MKFCWIVNVIIWRGAGLIQFHSRPEKEGLLQLTARSRAPIAAREDVFFAGPFRAAVRIQAFPSGARTGRRRTVNLHGSKADHGEGSLWFAQGEQLVERALR